MPVVGKYPPGASTVGARSRSSAPLPAAASIGGDSQVKNGGGSSVRDGARKEFLNSTAADWFDDVPAESASEQQRPPVSSSSSSANLNQPLPSVPSNVIAPGAHPATSEARAPPLAPERKQEPAVASPADSGSSTSNRNSIGVHPPSSAPASTSPRRKPLPAPTMDEAAPVPSIPVIYQKKSLNAQQVPQTSPTKKDTEDWVVLPTETADEQTATEIMRLNNHIAKMDRFKSVLGQPNIDLEKLRKLSWNGIPGELRPVTWQLLMGYLPCNDDRRVQTIAKKRADYQEYVRQSFERGESGLDPAISHQIRIDIPRTNPSVKLYQNPKIRESLERILYCWAIRHPASGYVQGINDLVTPFFQVFLAPVVKEENVECCNVDQISDETLRNVEADSFWCLSKLLDGIQDNYTHAQPGIHRQIQKMKELIGRIDAQLYAHIQTQGIDFIQFAFRWVNCLLMRELSLTNVIRMWDTYLSEGPDGFSDFHSYVCAAFLAKWSEHIRKLEFQDIMIFLQALPTKDWGLKEIELLLSEAYMWKSLFHNSPNHLSGAAVSTGNAWSI